MVICLQKKINTKRYRNQKYRLDDYDLRNRYESIEEDTKKIYCNIANILLKQGIDMQNEIITVLQKKSDNVNYKQIATYIGVLEVEKSRNI